MTDQRQRNALLSEEETLADYLKRRERELMQQTAALRALLVPKEKALEEIRQAMQAIGVQPSYAEALMPFLDQDQPPNPYVGILNQAEPLTIKEMILRALATQLSDGATPSELSEYIRSAYNRSIDRNSISPQLARLRDEGLVENTNALSGKWQLALRGTISEAIADTERRNVNALASTPPLKRRPKDIFD